ncbi:nodulin MtN21 /EamA-like transporter family protein [Striga asiatica]|uniref:WAT1-related protein n=1 Tax=Striga asiatica TaxID=4170 RepID=A0A5A7RC29_STRAF|nr:nodulin MtN21 /EamA-like transporter family protein [Striga asiatica]
MGSCLPLLGMLLAVTSLATNMIISKMAMSNGTSNFILSVYSNALATFILFPCAFLFHRSKRPPLTFPILCRIFLLALCGSVNSCLADISSYAGIKYSSPTLGTELLNLVPGFTYILAIIFRMEKFSLRKSSCISKLLGTIISIFGASIVTLYKGPAIINKILLTLNSSSSQQNWVVGGILLASAAFSTASWSIVQTWILKVYPAEMMIVAIYCLFVTMQSTLVGLIAENDITAWKLQTQIGLLAVLYAGIVNITFRLYMMSWCLSRTGPLFVSLFNPLTIVISVVIGVLFFHEVLYFGSVVGAIILVIGFYAVIWGKAKESEEVICVESRSHEVPLLQEGIEQA